MAEGRMQTEWWIASNQMALLANCHRDPRKGKPYTDRDFNPYELAKGHKRKDSSVTELTISEMRGVFKKAGVKIIIDPTIAPPAKG